MKHYFQLLPTLKSNDELDLKNRCQETFMILPYAASNESGICCTSICLVQTKYLCFSFTISLSKLNTIPNATIGKLKYLCNPDDTQSIKQIVSITIIGLWYDIKSHSLGFVWTINHVDYALFSEAWGFFSPKKIPHIVTQGQ